MNLDKQKKQKDPPEGDIKLILELLNSNKFIEAKEQINRQIVEYPHSSLLFNILGAVFSSQNQFDQAIDNFKKAITINPNYAKAYNNLGTVLHKSNKVAEAIQNYEKAINIDNNLAQALNNLGHALQEIGDNKNALYNFEKVIKIKPDYAEVYNSLGLILHDQRNSHDALLKYNKAIELKPNYEKAYNNLGNLLSNLGEYDKATDLYNSATRIKPDYAIAYSNLLLNLNYKIDFDIKIYLSYAKKFASNCKVIKKKFNDYQYEKNPSKLRLGFMSADFGDHPGGLFTLSTLKELKNKNFELFAYSTKDRKDETSKKFRPLFLKWNSVERKTDEEIVELIIKDGIHILIDVQGHSANNRLPIFLYKPAPIQVSWGAQGSTGIEEIDYFIGTPIITPKNEEQNYVEKIYRLPDVTHCFTPPDFELKIDPLPFVKNKFITFGCINKSTKINDKVIEVWSKILLSVPNSKLLLKNRDFNDKKIIENFLSRFEERKVNKNRIILFGESKTRKDLLKVYNQIDIALDPFPFQGNTSTCEAIWMGVPVLSLTGNRYLFHFGENINYNLKMHNWVAKNYDDYVLKAVNFCSDINKLSKIRKNLRKQISESSLFNISLFISNFEKMLWDMWKNFKK